TDEFYGYLANELDFTQCRGLVLDLVDFVQSHGPFHGVMGFSEGGIVAAMLLIEDSRHVFADFQCGIFFSSALPLDMDVLHTTGLLQCVDPAMTIDGSGLLKLPTAHILESNNWIKDPGKSLLQLCDEKLREVYLHELGHQIPDATSGDVLLKTLRAIERTIERAKR
ncbi:hypothetical protein BGW36DRAFT_307893, partial [Talaromyces proteolyticus]